MGQTESIAPFGFQDRNGWPECQIETLMSVFLIEPFTTILPL